MDGLKINSRKHFNVNYNGTPVTLKVASGRQRLAAKQHRNSVRQSFALVAGLSFQWLRLNK